MCKEVECAKGRSVADDSAGQVLMWDCCSYLGREIETKTRHKLTGEVDINDISAAAPVAKEEPGQALAEELEEEFDLSEEPATAA